MKLWYNPNATKLKKTVHISITHTVWTILGARSLAVYSLDTQLYHNQFWDIFTQSYPNVYIGSAKSRLNLGNGWLDSSTWNHDDVIKWKHFPRNWPFVRGIHRPPVNSRKKRPVTRSFDDFFDLNKRLRKQAWGWWFETLSRPLWRHCNTPMSVYMQPINRQPLVTGLPEG